MKLISQTLNETIFDYEGINKPFFETYLSNVNKLIVIQMKEPTKQNQKKINQIGIPIKSNEQKKIPKEINQLEQWTKLKFKEIIFDSDKDNWNKETSILDSNLIGKEKIIFIIETNISNITLGGFVNTKINQIGKIEDLNCFIFTNKNNKMTKYSIQKDKSQDAFELFAKENSMLFSFGNDIIVYKEDMKDKSYVNERNSCFEYGKEKRVLIGKIGTFSIKRIQVIQMK